MNGMNLTSVVLVSVLAFLASGAYYAVFAKQRAKLSKNADLKPKGSQIVMELCRNVIVALVVAYLINRIVTVTTREAISLAVLLWFAFPVVLLSGSVMYEKVPGKLAAIHAGDWFIKLMLMCVLLTWWQ